MELGEEGALRIKQTSSIAVDIAFALYCMQFVSVWDRRIAMGNLINK